jgi:hypothetical protein
MPTATSSSNRGDERGSEPFYFVSNLSKATIPEIWQATSTFRLLFPQIVLKKLLRRPLRIGVPIPAGDAAIIDLHEIPEDIQRSYEPLMKPLLEAGYVPKFGMAKHKSDILKGYSTVLISRDRMAIAVVTFAQIKDTSRTIMQVTSKRANNTFVATVNSARFMRIPPEIDALNLQYADAETVLKAHQLRISALTDLIPIADADAGPLVTGMARRITNFRVQCGLYVPATEEEMRRHGLLTVK